MEIEWREEWEEEGFVWSFSSARQPCRDSVVRWCLRERNKEIFNYKAGLVPTRNTWVTREQYEANKVPWNIWRTCLLFAPQLERLGNVCKDNIRSDKERVDECNEKITIQISTSFFGGPAFQKRGRGGRDEKYARIEKQNKQADVNGWGFFYWHKISTIHSLFIYIHLSRFIIANNKTGFRRQLQPMSDDISLSLLFSSFETSKQYSRKGFILLAICTEFSISQLSLKRSANIWFDMSLLSLHVIWIDCSVSSILI